ncbi:MAG: hypothetical protein CSA32_01440, partial [Desulfobulbus propionicus]
AFSQSDTSRLPICRARFTDLLYPLLTSPVRSGAITCACPHDFFSACLEGRAMKYPDEGWAEAKIIAEIKAACPRGAIYFEEASLVEPSC